MDSDFVVVGLPPDLAAHYRVERLLVEAVPMTGAAILRGAYTAWEEHKGHFVPTMGAAVPRKHEAALEELFVAATGSKTTDDVGTIREADYQHSKTREYGRGIRHSENRAGRWSYRRSKGR